jgi:triacylglycerol esterase/lipase EstA (alpha/beta hydrolase family)
MLDFPKAVIHSLQAMGLSGQAREVAKWAEALVAYPIGESERLLDRIVSPKTDGNTPMRNHPVLLLHGIAHNTSWSTHIQGAIEEKGFRTRAVNYSTLGHTIEDSASELPQIIDQLLQKEGADRVHIVAHSLGGLVVREALSRYHLEDKVASVTTIGTPHHGTPSALKLLGKLPIFGKLVAELTPDSDYIQKLDDTTYPTPDTKWCSIYSEGDPIVPGQSAKLTHPCLNATNIDMGNLGHMGLIYDDKAVMTLANYLTQVDQNCMEHDLQPWIKDQEDKNRKLGTDEPKVTEKRVAIKKPHAHEGLVR